MSLHRADKEAIRKSLQGFIAGGAVSFGDASRQLYPMDDSQSFLRQAQDELLDENEKLQMKIRLQSFMQKHPPASAKEGERFRWTVLWYRFGAVAAGLCLVAAGGTVSYAAEGSLPGDPLYPVKLYVNEPVLVALSLSSEAKAEAHERLVQRRLREIEIVIIQKGESAEEALDNDVRENLAYHLDIAHKTIAGIAEESPEVAAAESARFEAVLEAHTGVLTNLQMSGASSSKGEFLMEVIAAVEGGSKRASEARSSLETEQESFGRVSAEASLEESAKGIAEARRSLKDMHGKADEHILKNAERALEDAEKALSEGRATLQAEGFTEAFEKGKQANRKAEESRVMAIDAHGRASVKVEAEPEATAAEDAEKQNTLDSVIETLP